MTTYAAQQQASPLSPLVNEKRAGSPAAQALTGIVGVVLAVVLIVGQISLVTTKGIAVHLHTSVGNIQQGNEVMESVIERSAPSRALEPAVAQQAETLASTRDVMTALNGAMAEIGSITTDLDGTVGAMQGNSDRLASGVDAMNTQTGKINGLLGSLPDQTDKTSQSLSRISGDTRAINGELAALSLKLRRYGLPAAKNVKGRGK